MKKTQKPRSIPRLKGRPLGELVAMPHGGGLRAGGPNKGGPGRPPDALRALSRAQCERLLEELGQRDLSELTATELSQQITATGRLGGLARDDEPPEEVRITIVRDPPVDFGNSGRHDVQPALPEVPLARCLLPPPPHGPSKR